MLLFHIGLFFHMLSILIAGGRSVGAMLAERQLWMKVSERSDKAKVFLPILRAAPQFIMVGLILFLLSGLVLLYSVDWIYLKNPWFVAKLACFVLLPLRGSLVGKPMGAQLAKELNAEELNMDALMKLKARMKRFHFTQFLLVLVIIFLIIFKVK